MQSPLELRHLKTLVALREAGSLSRAAQLLSLTQSALSHQLKALEGHYGTALFERKSSPVSFGPAGQRLLRLADAVLPLLDEAERDVSRLVAGAAGTLRIAVECHTCFDWLMPSMDAFRARWPEVELDIVSGFQADPVGLLHQDRAELAIVSEADADEDGVVYRPLFSFEIVALLPRGHALLDRPWLEAADFAGPTLITDPLGPEELGGEPGRQVEIGHQRPHQRGRRGDVDLGDGARTFVEAQRPGRSALGRGAEPVEVGDGARGVSPRPPEVGALGPRDGEQDDLGHVVGDAEDLLRA